MTDRTRYAPPQTRLSDTRCVKAEFLIFGDGTNFVSFSATMNSFALLDDEGTLDVSALAAKLPLKEVAKAGT